MILIPQCNAHFQFVVQNSGLGPLVTIHNEGVGGTTGSQHSHSSVRWERAQPYGLVLLIKEDRELVSDCAVPSIQLTGVAAVTVRIRAYNATGELDIRRVPFTLGTRVLLTCDVTGLPEVISYRWYHNCAQSLKRMCLIQGRYPYYSVMKDTLLVDVTSLDQGGRYYCNADSLPVRKAAVTRDLPVAG